MKKPVSSRQRKHSASRRQLDQLRRDEIASERTGVAHRTLHNRMTVSESTDGCADLAGAGEGDGRFSGADHDLALYGGS